MPTKNALVINEPRVGFLVNVDRPDRPMAAQVTRKEHVIEVNLPWHSDEQREVDRWFMGNAMWGDDPNKDKYRYSPPTSFDFYDANGWIALVGCRDVGFRQQMATSVGLGRIAVDYALPGARPAHRYFKINGLRSEIDGLGDWMRIRSLDINPGSDSEGRLTTVQLNLDSPPPIHVSRSLNLSVRPAYRFGPGEHPDETTVTERMLVESDVRLSRNWQDHFDLHFAARDLLRIAAWRQLHFLKHEATRDDDPIRTLDGTRHGRQWHQVETVETDLAAQPSQSGRVHYLFYFKDVKEVGVGRWLRLRRDMMRAVAPIVRLLDLEGATLETHFAQLGIGLEALGFLIATERGMGKKRAGDQDFETRLRRITEDCRLPIPFPVDEWLKDMKSMYAAVKHANRSMPEVTGLYYTYYKGVQVFRLWLAGRLGVSVRSSAELETRTGLDRVQRILASA